MNGRQSPLAPQALTRHGSPHVAEAQQGRVVPTRRGALVLPPLNRPHRDAQERRDARFDRERAAKDVERALNDATADADRQVAS